MSSMDLDAPPLRSILMAIIIVVGLHVLTAVALVAIKPAAPKVELLKETPPIEIELIPLPTTLPVESEPVEVELQEAAPKPQPTSKPKPKLQPKSKEQKVQEKKPETTPRVKQEKTATVNQEKPLQKNTRQEKKQHPNIDKAIADEQRDNQQRANEKRSIVAAQAEKAAQEAHAQAVQDAKRLADAKAARDAQAEADAKAINEAASEAAKKAAAIAAKQAEEAAARAKAEAAAKTAQAESNEPQSFNGKDAAWITPPNFEDISDKAQTLTLRFTVTKQGNIENIKIDGSKNIKIDREVRRRLKYSKIKPFIQNGTPVVGIVTLSIKVKP